MAKVAIQSFFPLPLRFNFLHETDVQLHTLISRVGTLHTPFLLFIFSFSCTFSLLLFVSSFTFLRLFLLSLFFLFYFLFTSIFLRHLSTSFLGLLSSPSLSFSLSSSSFPHSSPSSPSSSFPPC